MDNAATGPDTTLSPDSCLVIEQHCVYIIEMRGICGSGKTPCVLEVCLYVRPLRTSMPNNTL